MSDKLNEVGTCTIEIMYVSVSLNCVRINIYLLLASPYTLKHLKESASNKFFPELLN